jgi:hypothetical protein
MAGNLQPLDEKFAITGADGRPTQYFIRWAQQRQIDIGEAVSAAQALKIVEQFLADHPLIAGSGINLAPSGNIADDVTVSADVQAILDQISTTRGSILYRGVADWMALAPGASGEFLRTNGAGADPTWSVASGGGGSLSLAKNIQTKPPRSASFPFSIGSPVVTEVSNALYITGPTSATQVRAALKTAQAASFTVIVRLRAGLRDNFNHAGIVFTNGTRYLNVGPLYATGGFIEISQFSNSTTFNSAVSTVDFNSNNDIPDWFKAEANPSTGVVSGFYSWDGVHWISMGSNSTYLSSITRYGIGIVSRNASVPADASFTYYEDGTAADGIEVTTGGGGGGGIAASFETVSKNLSAENATLTYSGGNLTSIAYANGITKTLNYSGGNLASIVLSGSTPGGIDLTKTLTYTGSDLTSIAYS